MNPNLIRWSAVIGAISRILHYREVLGATKTYFERLRIVNEALGPHWIFRLADTVGIELIKMNRPSWYQFYVEDVDGLHCPLDPGAPETEAYLGRRYSDMDLAFYAGMGFDGYRLALQTPRLVSLDTKSIDFDGRYHLTASTDLRNRLVEYDTTGSIPKEHYYSAYGDTLAGLYKKLDNFVGDGPVSEEILEQVAASCLILLCGGHKGCRRHRSAVEKFEAQMESLIIFGHVQHILSGQVALKDVSTHMVRAVA